jgi:hypothetical protein
MSFCSASSCFYDADASSAPGGSRDQKQPCPDDDGPDGSRDALTSRCETFDGDGCRHDRHRAKVHDPDDHIIATIITTHMPRNDAAAPGHVCPGIRIHAIDMVQPPGIGISPIADMDSHQTIVSAALAAKSSAERPKKARREASLGRHAS